MAPRSPPVRIFDPLLVRALCHAVGGCGGDPVSTRLGHWYTMRYSGPGGFEVDDEFESGRLHNGQVGRLGAPEYLASVDADLVPRVCEAAAVADQSTGRNALAPSINRRQGMPRRQHDDLTIPDREERRCACGDNLGPTR